METFIYVYLAVINLTGFIVCAADKRAAVMQRRRVSERTLFVLALAGGAAGVYLAMMTMRHKTQKRRFTVLIPLIIALQAGAAVWLLWGK